MDKITKKEIQLTKSDFKSIVDHAHRSYTERSTKTYGEENFLCECYLEAIKWYTSANNWTIEGGKILKSGDR